MMLCLSYHGLSAAIHRLLLEKPDLAVNGRREQGKKKNTYASS